MRLRSTRLTLGDDDHHFRHKHFARCAQCTETDPCPRAVATQLRLNQVGVVQRGFNADRLINLLRRLGFFNLVWFFVGRYFALCARFFWSNNFFNLRGRWGWGKVVKEGQRAVVLVFHSEVSKPCGFIDCQRHASAHMRSKLCWVCQFKSLRAWVGSARHCATSPARRGMIW